jgi:hypothetical protein
VVTAILLAGPAVPAGARSARAWVRLDEIFRAGFGRNGADLSIGRRLTERYREAGLEDIQVTACSPLFVARGRKPS